MSERPSTILLCYDGSTAARHAIAVAGRLFPGAHAHVLNVWEPIERIVARYSALAPFMGEEVGEADADAPRRPTASPPPASSSPARPG